MQYRPRIVDTDIDCEPRFCGPRFRDFETTLGILGLDSAKDRLQKKIANNQFGVPQPLGFLSQIFGREIQIH